MSDGVEFLTVSLHVNGVEHRVEVSADDTLVDVLRGELHLTGCRETCGLGLCGSCTVVVDGRAVSACLAPAFQLDGAVIRTAEGLQCEAEPCGLQRVFIDGQAFQCSFCTPGILMSATAMIEEDGPHDVKETLSGHLCRCGSYEQIVAAVSLALEATDPPLNCGIQ